MKPGRNDPCPCGSARKYKHCCQALDARPDDATRERGQLPATLRTLREVDASESSWQVEAVPLQISFAEQDDLRPVAVLVTADGFVLHYDLRPRLSGEPAAVAAALEDEIVKASQEGGFYPEVVEIRHQELVAPLQQRMAARGVTVRLCDALPELEPIACSLMEEMAGSACWPPVCAAETWSGWDLPRTLVTDLFDAAASYWRAQPWEVAANLQAVRITLPSGQEWTAAVLGNAGEHFGLVLYADGNDLVRASAEIENRLLEHLGIAFEPEEA